MYAISLNRHQRDWSKFVVPDKVPNQETKSQFKPFDKVLVRDVDDGTWVCDIFSHMDKRGRYCCVNTYWEQCIHYEGNEHLVGTSNKPE